jgi:hypothetical protein
MPHHNLKAVTDGHTGHAWCAVIVLFNEVSVDAAVVECDGTPLVQVLCIRRPTPIEKGSDAFIEALIVLPSVLPSVHAVDSTRAGIEGWACGSDAVRSSQVGVLEKRADEWRRSIPVGFPVPAWMMSRLRKSPSETLQDYCAASDMAEASIAALTDKVLPARGPDGVSDGSRPGPSEGAAGEETEVTLAAHNCSTTHNRALS